MSLLLIFFCSILKCTRFIAEIKALINNCNNNKKKVYYQKLWEKVIQIWIWECKESFTKGFMIATGFSYNGKLKIRRVERNAKIYSSYFLKNTMFTEEIRFLYPNDFERVKLHQDKATVILQNLLLHSLKEWKPTQAYLPLQYIFVKSPDISPMDYCCAFVQLKRALSKQKSTIINEL